MHADIEKHPRRVARTLASPVTALKRAATPTRWIWKPYVVWTLSTILLSTLASLQAGREG